MTGLATCEAPREPHVKPPSGQSPRSQSIEVHRAAAPSAFSSGMAGAPDQWKAGAEQRHGRGREHRQGAPGEGAEELQPRERESEAHESVDEAEGEATRRRRVPQPDQQQRGSDECQRPGGHGREGERGQHAADQGEGERDRQPGVDQAQSRQNIRRLSASWLRCFTR